MISKQLFVVVERDNGTTFHQQIQFIKDIKTSISNAKKYFGKGYYICCWYWS